VRRNLGKEGKELPKREQGISSTETKEKAFKRSKVRESHPENSTNGPGHILPELQTRNHYRRREILPETRRSWRSSSFSKHIGILPRDTTPSIDLKRFFMVRKETKTHSPPLKKNRPSKSPGPHFYLLSRFLSKEAYSGRGGNPPEETKSSSHSTHRGKMVGGPSIHQQLGVSFHPAERRYPFYQER